jgi:AraC-like DNA-binding protein
MSRHDELRDELYRTAPGLAASDALFDSLDDVVYCVKNRARQYISVNAAFVARVRLANKGALLGRTAREIFPLPMAIGFEQQDDVVFRTGKAIGNRLERITNIKGEWSWFLAHKVPVHDVQGRVIAVAGISRDLNAPEEQNPGFAAIAKVIEVIQRDYALPLRMQDLARDAGLTPSQFERRVRAIVHISPRQLLTKTRLEAAAAALRETQTPIGDIALSCGFYDQAMFSRQFRQATGLSPRQYRELA